MSFRKFLVCMTVFALCLSCSKPDAQPPVGDNGNGQDQELELPSDGLVEKTFIVSNLKTKTSFDGSVTDTGYAVLNWCADDSIAVWDGTAIRVFNMISEPQAEQTVFKGRVAEDADEFYAIYPCADMYSYKLKDRNADIEVLAQDPWGNTYRETVITEGTDVSAALKS